MRKIETQMNSAIEKGINWHSSNTVVTFDQQSGESSVYLHGNHIATIGEGFVQLFDGGWQSNTSKSRLTAILEYNCLPGERVYQKAYVWNVRLTDGTSIPFFSGMRLN